MPLRWPAVRFVHLPEEVRSRLRPLLDDVLEALDQVGAVCEDGRAVVEDQARVVPEAAAGKAGVLPRLDRKSVV